jgi:hypothetical protein
MMKILEWVMGLSADKARHGTTPGGLCHPIGPLA